MAVPVVVFLFMAVVAAVARYRMWQNLGAMRLELAELEVESRRVGGELRRLDGEMERLEETDGELSTEVRDTLERLSEVDEQLKQIKDLTRRRIERELITRN